MKRFSMPVGLQQSVMIARLRQTLGQSWRFRVSQYDLAQVRTAQVGIDEKGSKSGLRESHCIVERTVTFALGRIGAREEHRFAVFFRTQERDRRPKRTKCFRFVGGRVTGEDRFFVEIFALGLGNRRQHGKPRNMFQLIDAADGVVGHVGAERPGRTRGRSRPSEQAPE